MKLILTETNRETKAKRLFKNPSQCKMVKTFAILTENNPDTVPHKRKVNNEFNKELKYSISFDNLESVLNNYSFNYYKVKGMYGNKEDSFLIYNLALDDAKSLAKSFKQQSFIFGKNTEDGLKFELWAKCSKTEYVYKKADERSIWLDMEDAEDYYTQISKDFKFNIPFEKFEFNDSEMIEKYYVNYNKNAVYTECFEHNLEQSLSENLTFAGRRNARSRLLNK